jgi:hypothetical protein
VALGTGCELVGDPLQRRCYICRAAVSGEPVRKDYTYGAVDGSEVSKTFYLDLCPGHEDMDTWPWDRVVGFHLVSCDAMGVPSPFD